MIGWNLFLYGKEGFVIENNMYMFFSIKHSRNLLYKQGATNMIVNLSGKACYIQLKVGNCINVRWKVRVAFAK